MTRLQHTVRVSKVLGAGVAASVCMAAVATRVPEGVAFGVWLLALAAVIFPALWASAQVDHWMDASTDEAKPAPVTAPGPFELYRGAPGHTATDGPLVWPLSGQMTINDLVRLSGQIAHSKGWNEQHHPVITSEAAYAQLSALTPVVLALGHVVRMARKHPGDSPEVIAAVQVLQGHAEDLTQWRSCLVGAAREHAARLEEYGLPMAGSKTEALAHMVLRVSEAAEEAHGVIAGDLPNTLEEIGDQWIRAGARLWSWAFVAPPTWAEVPNPSVLADFEAVLRAKMEQNVGMEHRKGGLRA